MATDCRNWKISSIFSLYHDRYVVCIIVERTLDTMMQEIFTGKAGGESAVDSYAELEDVRW